MIGKTSQIELLSRVLDAAHLRHAVIAQNLANVNTPNYHRLEVSFEDELKQAMTKHRSVSTAKPTIVETSDAPARADGNTVDIDVEMGLLTKNTLMMTAASQIMVSRLAALRSAISGR